MSVQDRFVADLRKPCPQRRRHSFLDWNREREEQTQTAEGRRRARSANTGASRHATPPPTFLSETPAGSSSRRPRSRSPNTAQHHIQQEEARMLATLTRPSSFLPGGAKRFSRNPMTNIGSGRRSPVLQSRPIQQKDPAVLRGGAVPLPSKAVRKGQLLKGGEGIDQRVESESRGLDGAIGRLVSGLNVLRCAVDEVRREKSLSSSPRRLEAPTATAIHEKEQPRVIPVPVVVSAPAARKDDGKFPSGPEGFGAVTTLPQWVVPPAVTNTAPLEEAPGVPVPVAVHQQRCKESAILDAIHASHAGPSHFPLDAAPVSAHQQRQVSSSPEHDHCARKLHGFQERLVEYNASVLALEADVLSVLASDVDDDGLSAEEISRLKAIQLGLSREKEIMHHRQSFFNEAEDCLFSSSNNPVQVEVPSTCSHHI